MQMRTTLAVGVVSCVLVAGGARAVDQTILGNGLTVRNPGSPDKRRVTGKAKEKGSPNTIVGNPVLSGGTLTVTADGGTPTTQTIVLPQGTSSSGKPYWTGDAVKGFKYRNPKGELGIPVKLAQIKKSPSGTFTVKALLSGKFAPLVVTPPNPGTEGCVRLALTGGDTYHVRFAAGDGIVTNKGAVLYRHRKVTGQGICPVVTTTTTTTMASSTTTSTTTLYGSPSRAFVDRVLGLLD
jgi:hypothetical protein